MEESILVFGDVCPSWGWPELFATRNVDKLFGNLLPIMNEATQIIANLECPLTDAEEKETKTGPNLKAPSDSLQALKQVGVSAVSLANNHIRDYGNRGVLDTIRYCNELSIPFFGAGDNSQDAARPLFLMLGQKKIGFLAFAEEEFNCVSKTQAGANRFDPYVSFGDIGRAKQSCDRLVVLYHGGIEHYRYPSPLLQKKCHAMIDAGADLVLCQHSHCIGTLENYGAGKILYGQGNSVFGYKVGKTEWNRGLVVKLVAVEELTVSFIPIEATQNGLVILDESVVDELIETSNRLQDKDFIDNNWIKFCQPQKAEYLAMLFAKGRVFNKLNRLTNNLLINTLHRNRMTSMNIIRCDAHREVAQTVLEQDFYDKPKK
ncbi:MAG: CapA family protein [Eubacteriales bacterium]|nr:CapA family protein [Eubacteriales bacterium]